MRENFVAVSLHGLEYDRTDAVGQFLRAARMNISRLEGGKWCVTADGKILESNLVVAQGKETFKPDFNLKEALEKWKALPAAERAPGAVQVGELGAVDTRRAGLTPPPGTLILKVYYRAFMREGGQLRYLTGNDLWYDEQGVKRAGKTEDLSQPQAQPDHMWLTEAEGKSLMPAKPHVGDQFPLPAGISERLVRRHLNPGLVYHDCAAVDRNLIRAAALNLTVEAVSANSVRLRLDGQAALGSQPTPEVAAGKVASMAPWGYEPKLLGYLEYHPQKQVFTRFEVVALGDHFGRLGGNGGPTRRGCQPLGISFALVRGDRPFDRVAPGSDANSRTYFDPAR